jgi:catechol 2,3-dioxygenase-like lactoylglutathione lyase family enzyme
VSIPIRGLIPLLSVKSVPASIAFYQLLGFELANTHTPEDDSEPVWAYLKGDDCSLMVGEAEQPAPTPGGLTIYMYVDDVVAKHAELSAAGVAVEAVEYPFWSKRGEFRLKDPDGFDIVIAHT